MQKLRLIKAVRPAKVRASGGIQSPAGMCLAPPGLARGVEEGGERAPERGPRVTSARKHGQGVKVQRDWPTAPGSGFLFCFIVSGGSLLPHQFFSSCGNGRYSSLTEVRGLLIVVASLVAECGL